MIKETEAVMIKNANGVWTGISLDYLFKISRMIHWEIKLFKLPFLNFKYEYHSYRILFVFLIEVKKINGCTTEPYIRPYLRIILAIYYFLTQHAVLNT